MFKMKKLHIFLTIFRFKESQSVCNKVMAKRQEKKVNSYDRMCFNNLHRPTSFYLKF